jgi:hypothetical protein
VVVFSLFGLKNENEKPIHLYLMKNSPIITDELATPVFLLNPRQEKVFC